MDIAKQTELARIVDKAETQSIKDDIKKYNKFFSKRFLPNKTPFMDDVIEYIDNHKSDYIKFYCLRDVLKAMH